MGEKLSKAIEAAGVTKAELARQVGVSPAFVTYMVKGYKQPTAMLLKRMAEFLGVRMEELI